MAKKTSRELRIKRHIRIRKYLEGTTERPRLNVFRSGLHIYAQVIDDSIGHTLVAASTVQKDVQAQLSGLSRRDQAHVVGKVLAERAQKAGITKVVFDRGGYRFHGRVQALAEGAREGGLSF